MDIFKSILDIVAVVAILIVFSYIILRFIPRLRKKEEEPTNHTLSTIENLVTLVITLSFGMFGYNIYNAYDIKQTKLELEEIMESIEDDYRANFAALKSLERLTSSEFLYDRFGSSELLDFQLINEDVKDEVEENLSLFSTIFVASAILTTEETASIEALNAWHEAMKTNPELDIAQYGYALECFKYGLSLPKIETGYTQESLTYFKTAYDIFTTAKLQNVGQANYYVGMIGYIIISNIEKLNLVETNKEAIRAAKYEIARKGVLALNNVNSESHNLGAVDYNLYLNFYALAKNTRSLEEYNKYKKLAIKHYEKIKSLNEYRDVTLWKMDNNFINE